MANRLTEPFMTFNDANGNPLAGGFLNFYISGSVADPKDTFSTPGLGVANLNPVALDSAGRASVDIWGNGEYKMVVMNASGIIQGDAFDPVVGGFVLDSVDTIADMTSLSKSSLSNNDLIFVAGYNSIGDGGQGSFYWNEVSSATANGGTIIASDEGGSGRWLRLVSGALNVKAFGALVDGATNDAVAVTSLVDSGNKPYFPAGTTLINVTAANIDTLLGTLDNFSADGLVSMIVDAGVHNFTSQIVLNSEDLKNVSITGAATTLMTASGQAVTGSAKAWLVTTTVTDAAAIDVGDFITVDPTGGTGLNFYNAAGLWKVTGKAGSDITFKSTSHSATLPADGAMAANIRVYKTVLNFATSDGLRFEGSQPLASFNQIIVEGDWDVAAATGTTGAHGVVTSSPVVTPGGDSNETFDSQGIVTLGPLFGVYGFGEQGIVMSGRTAGVMNFVYSCANRKRGVYAEGASIRGKFMNCSGNGEDGFISDTVGFLQCGLSKAVGNGLNGFWSTNNSIVVCATSIAASNGSNGYEARGLTRMSADLGKAYDNALDGFRATDGGMIDADSAVADGNTGDGYAAATQSIIDCNNSTSTNNTDGYDSQVGSLIVASGSTASGNAGTDYKATLNSLLLDDSGVVVPCEQEFGGTEVFTSDRVHVMALAVSSIGDGIFSLDGVQRILMKNGGAFTPSADNTQQLGSGSNRWSEVFAGNGTINTSDAREKTEVTPLTSDELAAAVDLSKEIGGFKWRASVESKGDDARYHIGMTVQRAIEIMEAHNLDPTAYGFICYDEWEEEGETVYRYGFRYSQLTMFMQAGVNADVEARLIAQDAVNAAIVARLDALEV